MANNSNSVFSFLYNSRVKVTRNSLPIVNLSLLFTGIAFLTAPWLVIGGAIAAACLGYKFSFQRRDPQFTANFDDVIRDAAGNVRRTVNQFTQEQ